VNGVLLDLDGTLVDTAPDLVAVLNALLVERKRPRMPYALARNEVSNGSAGLIRLGFGAQTPADEFEILRARFLELYLGMVCINSRLLIDLSELSGQLCDVAWGVVTNKPDVFTQPLLKALGIAERFASVVSGDRLPQRKPDPAPLLLAARELGIAPEHCIYVGDAPRDIEAGRAAGMSTVAAAFGYVRPQENVLAWGADAIAHAPRDLGPTLRALLQRSRA
jgi:2-phosphoglycolate phosphatase